MTITFSRLLELVEYDNETGIMVSIADRSAARGCGRMVKKCQILGRPNKKGYLQTTIDRKTYLIHRLAWLYETGSFPSYQLDHIDGNRANNAFINLRECIQSENNQNVIKTKKSCTSGHVGVCYAQSKGCWIAYLKLAEKQIQKFAKNEQDAILARAELKKQFHKFNPFDRKVA